MLVSELYANRPVSVISGFMVEPGHFTMCVYSLCTLHMALVQFDMQPENLCTHFIDTFDIHASMKHV